MKHVLSITVEGGRLDEIFSEDHFVEGFDFLEKCIWSYVHKNLIQDGPLSFFISSAHLQNFKANYEYFKEQVKPSLRMLLAPDSSALPEIENLFNLDSFTNIFQIDLIDAFQRNLVRLWTYTNDQLTPVSKMVGDMMLQKVLGEAYFIRNEPKIDAWTVKFLCQMSIRYFRFFEDQLEEKSSGSSAAMGTERVLFVIDDVFRLREILLTEIAPKVKSQTNLSSELVDKLFHEILQR